MVFIDDYFNCMTVGAVMRPVTDRFRVSHEKLAVTIDSSAAPVCIIAPVSSWAVAVGGYLGENGFSTFVESIPYNFYALATIVFVFYVCASNMDFGPMLLAERRARNAGLLDPHPRNEAVEAAPEQVEFDGMRVSTGTVSDLVIPIATLIVFSVVGMLYRGGFFEGVDFATAVGVGTDRGPVHRRRRCFGRGCGHVSAARPDHAFGLHGRHVRGPEVHGFRHHDFGSGLVAGRRVPLYDRVRGPSSATC